MNIKKILASPAVENLAVAAAYYGTGRIGLLMAGPPGIATAVWPPSGIALAALLIWGRRVWPGILAASVLLNLNVLVGPASSLMPFCIAAVIGLGSTLQALTGASLAEKMIGTHELFDRVKNVFRFTAIEFFVCLISPACAMAAMLLSGRMNWSAAQYTGWTWWAGDFLGVMVMTPLLLVWNQPARKFQTRLKRWEKVFYYLCLFVVSFGVFTGPALKDAAAEHILLPYVLVPFIVWGAFWFGLRGVTASIFVISSVAIAGCLEGRGPFAHQSLNDSFLMLQPFIAILSLTGLVFCSALWERRLAHEELQRNQADLKDFVENAAVGLNWVGPNGIILWANKAEREMLGYEKNEYIGHHISEFHADPKILEDILYRLKNHEQLLNYEAKLRCKDGRIKTVMISANVLWENGSFVHTRCFTQDITDRKKAQEGLLKAHAELEARVAARTEELSQAYKALEKEMAWRLRAQRDILEISEREQKRIGQDLHDGIAQQLAGLSFMAKTLQYKLLEKGMSEAGDVERILEFLKKTIDDTRRLSRGFYPVELEKLGLVPALEELAMDTEKIYAVPCFYKFDHSINIQNDATAAHVYRMTQEAVSNAVKHAKPHQLNLSMKRENGHVVLAVEDDGIGIDKKRIKPKMGLRIMDYRAKMIGASLDIEKKMQGGTCVSFRFKAE